MNVTLIGGIVCLIIGLVFLLIGNKVEKEENYSRG